MHISSKAIKLIGIGVNVVGIGAGLVSDWVSNKKLDNLVEEKVAEALKEVAKKES